MDTNGNLRVLLLKDLCGRLPYGVIVYNYDREETREMGLGTLHDIMFNDLECKPYLRPMSSMTEEEYEQYRKFSYYGAAGYRNNDYKEMVTTPSFEKMDFLNAHHFDYRGLIEKGLALEAPEGMYKEWISIRGNLKEDKEGNIVGGLKL